MSMGGHQSAAAMSTTWLTPQPIIDALEPSILEALIEREVSNLIDEEIWEETETEQQSRREILKSLHNRFDDIKEFLGAE